MTLCFHVDDSGSGIHTSYYMGMACKDVGDDYLGLTLQFHSMLESDTPLLDQSPTVQGSLQRHVTFWEKEIKPSEFVLDIVKFGYRLPFISFPQPLLAENHHSALVHAEFVKDSMQELVQANCAQESLSCPTVCSPLQVVSNAKGKLRLVIDRYLNQFLVQIKFKYEGLDFIPSLFKKGDFAFSFDLKSG